MSSAWVLAASLLLFSICGCGSMRPTTPPEALNCGLEHFRIRDIYEQLETYRAERIRTEGLNDPKPSFNVLALSAGGEFGAYGAGFLRGWRSAGNAAKPSPLSDIQIVTGVSTGAILATHAFLGREDEIESVYRSVSGSKIYASRNVLELLWANSLFNTRGKDRLIEESLTTEVIEDVAKSPDGRYLYIGVVNLDTGEFIRIDMVALAKTIAPEMGRDDCYRAVVGASSAIPIAFAPKFVDGKMLVDGGARRHLFITDLPAAAKAPNVERNLISFIHGDLNAGCSETPNGVVKIAGRTASLFTDQSFKDSIRFTDVLAKEQIPGPTPSATKPLFATYYAAASTAAKDCEYSRKECGTSGSLGGEDMFCKEFMNCLATRGKVDGGAYATGSRPWLQIEDLNLSSKPSCDSRVPTRTLLQ